MDRGTVCNDGMSRDIFSKFDLVYSGHFHHPSSVGNISYLGAPYEMNWGDFNGKRGFHIFDTSTRELKHIPNPYRLFHKITYEDIDLTVEDINQLDISNLIGTYIKVIIKNKSNPYLFDMFLDKLTQSGAADIKIIDEESIIGFGESDEVIIEAEDTLTILKNYISSIETKVNKNKVEDAITSLYIEALNQ